VSNILKMLFEQGARSKGSAQIMVGNGPIEISWDHTRKTRSSPEPEAPEEAPAQIVKGVVVVHSKVQLSKVLEDRTGFTSKTMKKWGLSSSLLYGKGKISSDAAKVLLKKGQIQIGPEMVSTFGRWKPEEPPAKGKLKIEL